MWAIWGKFTKKIMLKGANICALETICFAPAVPAVSTNPTANAFASATAAPAPLLLLTLTTDAAPATLSTATPSSSPLRQHPLRGCTPSGRRPPRHRPLGDHVPRILLFCALLSTGGGGRGRKVIR